MNSDSIIRRIEQNLDSPGLANLLASQLSPTDLQSLLLAVYRKQSASRTPADVLADYQRNRFVEPSTTGPLGIYEVEMDLQIHLPEQVKPIELSPVCPLGTSSVLAGVSQDWSVPTARNTEVVSDATNVLALECALQRRSALRTSTKSDQQFHCCANHRLLRPQFNDNLELSTHFRLFHICSAGRDQGSMAFECESLFIHAFAYLTTLSLHLPRDANIKFLLTDFHVNDRYAHLETNLLSRLSKAFPNVNIGIQDEREAGRGYYRDLCFHIYAHPAGKDPIQLGRWWQR